jgi:hypothetical protein
MLKSFHPPEVSSLVEIDICKGVTYSGESEIIEGVVSPESQGVTFGAGKGRFKVHILQLAAWRRSAEPVVAKELIILRAVPNEYKDCFDDFPKLSVQRFRVLISTDRERSVLEEVLAVEAIDAELQAIAEDLKTPIVVATQQFGDLTLNRRTNSFEGRIKWNRKAIDVRFSTDGTQLSEMALQTATAFWVDQARRKKTIEAHIVEKFLTLKNEDWLGDDESPVTAKEFLKRLTPVSVTFSDDQEWVVSYDDGDLFWGHYFTVRGTLGGEIIDVGLAG